MHIESLLCGAGGTVAYISFYWTTALFLAFGPRSKAFSRLICLSNRKLSKAAPVK